MSLELLNRIKQTLEERKRKVESGGVNGIPIPFKRFRTYLPVIEQKNIIIVTGATKSSKTQFTNFVFVYNTVLYYYHNPEKIRAKIFFFPLEETKEAITLRFIAYLLFYISKGKVIVSPKDLKSSDERYPVSQEILDMMNLDEFKAIFEIYEDIVIFCEDRNPTGIYKKMVTYAESHGKVIKRPQKFTEVDAFGNKTEKTEWVFDRYEPDDPDEYVFCIADHLGLLSIETQLGTLKATIEKLSDYFIQLRNKYHYICVGVQQQNTETTNLEAYKSGKIRPTKDGLKDTKRTGEDCDMLIGLTNPHAFELPDYMGYPIKDAFKGNIRFAELVLYRGGEANNICPLYFNGSINQFEELPLPSEKDRIDKILEYIRNLRNNDSQRANPILLIGNLKKTIKQLQKKKLFNMFATLFTNKFK